MDLLTNFIDIFMHLDKHLNTIIQSYGTWTYMILFLIIFCETGLVIMPILPGDSLLFAAGAIAAMGSLDPVWLFGLLTIAAIAGDTLNYSIGHYLGPKVFQLEDSRFFKKEYLERTHQFYEKHGGKTIVIARFMPIIRTFAPFVAGIGAMEYHRFFMYNVTGALLWGALFVFGNIPAVAHNFTLVILAIILVSVLPGVIEFLRHRRRDRPEPEA